MRFLLTMLVMIGMTLPAFAQSSDIIKDSVPTDPRLTYESWPQGQTFVESNTLPFSPLTPAYDWPEVNGQRMFSFFMKPGEELSFKLKGESSKICMRAYISEPPPAFKWRMSLESANRPVRQIRLSRFKIKNESPDIQQFILIVYGVHGYSYRVDMTRKEK